MVFGLIVIIYNIKGVSMLNFDGFIIVKIFNGIIIVWNDL